MARWSLVGVVIGSVLAALGAGVDPAGAQSPATQDAPPVDASALAPDLTVLITATTLDQPAEVAADLGRIEGVARAVIDAEASPDGIVHVALDEGSGQRRPLPAVVDAVTDVLGERFDGAEIVVGGAAVVDDELAGRFARTARTLALLAVLIGVAIGAFDGWRHSLVIGAGSGLAVLAAGSIGAQIAGSFDGSIASTGLPAALAGLALATALAARLLVWFRRPDGGDGAAKVERAVRDLGPELVLLFAGVTATAVVVDVMGPGRSASTVAAVGAAVATVVLIAVVAPALALVGPAERSRAAGPLPLRLRDGRDLPLAVVALGAFALLIVSVAAFGAIGDDLADVTDLAADEPAAEVAAVQARRGGDPTRAVVVDPNGASVGDFAGWVSAAAERPEVAWVDVGSRRIAAAATDELEPWASLALPGDERAVIVPAVSPRSADGQQLIERLSILPLAGAGPSFAGPGAETDGMAGSRGAVVATIVGLAATAALATQIIAGNRALALVSFALRLLGGAMTAGLLNLVSVQPSTAALVTLVAAVGIVSLVAELELARWLASESEVATAPPGTAARSPIPGPIDATPGQYGAVGLAALGLGGLVAAISGAVGTGALGLALALAVVIELAVATAVLRPALLGQRSAYQTAARPLRVALHGRSTGDPDDAEPPDDDPAWREVVSDLINTEFWFQTDPERADLDAVFEPDTPVHRQAVERQGSLAGSGLRVVGRNPELRSLRTIRGRQPVIVTVTVDHSPSRLLDRDGRVVGVRRPERRIGRLWLAASRSGGHRIVESVELGVTPLGDDDGPAGGDDTDVGVGNGVDIDLTMQRRDHEPSPG